MGDGECGEEFDEGRMLRVESVVVCAPHHVSGEHVIVFVEGQRFAMNDVDDLGGLDDEEEKGDGPYARAIESEQVHAFLYQRRG